MALTDAAAVTGTGKAEGAHSVGRRLLQSLMIPLINLLLTDFPLHREAAGGFHG